MKRIYKDYFLLLVLRNNCYIASNSFKIIYKNVIVKNNLFYYNFLIKNTLFSMAFHNINTSTYRHWNSDFF